MFLAWTSLLVIALVVPGFHAQGDECEINGQTFQRGDSIGDALPTRCGPSSEFPCFCNSDLPFQAECPFCGFTAGDGTFHCARRDERIIFRDGTIHRNCSCTFPNGTDQPSVRECTIADVPTGGVCEFRTLEGDLLYFQDEDSFGELFDGVCGPATNWPSFCNARPDSLDYLIDYPYCVFDDAAAGGVICAKNLESVSYDNKDGDQVTCNCVYSQDGGAQPSCKTRPNPSGDSTSPPTAAPNSAGDQLAVKHGLVAVVFTVMACLTR